MWSQLAEFRYIPKREVSVEGAAVNPPTESIKTLKKKYKELVICTGISIEECWDELIFLKSNCRQKGGRYSWGLQEEEQ